MTFRESIAEYITQSGKSLTLVAVKAKMTRDKLQEYFMGVSNIKADKLTLLLSYLRLSVAEKDKEYAEVPTEKMYEVINTKVHEKGLNQQILADELSVNRVNLSNYLNGIKTLQCDALEKLITKLELDLKPYKE